MSDLAVALSALVLKQVRRGRRLAARSGVARRCGYDAAAIANDLVQPRQDLVQGLRLVGNLELQERGLLHHRFGTLGIVDARELDDDAVVADLLHDRLGDAELVDARADDLERAIERIAHVGHRLLGLVDLEREVHAALQVESALERDSAHGIVGEGAVTLDALHHRPRPQLPKADAATSATIRARRSSDSDIGGTG